MGCDRDSARSGARTRDRLLQINDNGEQALVGCGARSGRPYDAIVKQQHGARRARGAAHPSYGKSVGRENEERFSVSRAVKRQPHSEYAALWPKRVCDEHVRSCGDDDWNGKNVRILEWLDVEQDA